MPERPQSFDAALCLQVPDLVENDPLFFDAVKTALRPGGILFVTVTNRASYKAVMRKWLGRGKPQLETIQFSQVNVYQASVAELIARADACGFQLQASVGFNWLPFAKGSNSKLINPAAKAERLLGLRGAAGISPWAMLHFALGE